MFITLLSFSKVRLYREFFTIEKRGSFIYKSFENDIYTNIVKGFRLFYKVVDYFLSQSR